MIDEAVDISVLNKISFWDAAIIAAARAAKCKVLYAEDMSSGHLIAGIEVINPFKVK